TYITDVGRPDLAIKQGEITKEDLAGYLFDSLREKIMPLADDIIVYPGHGAGSACGKKMDKATEGLLGDQKKFNYALRTDMTKQEFIEEVTTGLATPPAYFAQNAMMNKMGYESFAKVYDRGSQPLNITDFKQAWQESGAVVIDARRKESFVKGFIPGSIFIGLDGTFAPWVGALIPDLKHPLLFIAHPGDEEEVLTRLARVGHDNVIGYLDDGFSAWKMTGEEVDHIAEISAEDFVSKMKSGATLLDVRKKNEFNSQHLIGSINFPLDTINQNTNQLDRSKHYFLNCASGYRSVIAASILRARGFKHLTNVQGGFKALANTQLKKSNYAEQVSEL
ncbi:MAG: rhodanese-like domain-containing protein, partial [Bacteroidota bacterium]